MASIQSNAAHFASEANLFFPDFLVQIKARIRLYFLLSAAFWIVIALELILFFSSLLTVALSKESAFLLALFFATLFSYLMLRLYFSAQKEQALLDLAQNFVGTISSKEPTGPMSPKYHLTIGSMANRASLWLKNKECYLFEFPEILNKKKAIAEKISKILGGKDCLRLRECLLELSIFHHTKAIQLAPLDLDSHMLLANTYILLSQLYTLDPTDPGDLFTFRRTDREQFLSRHKQAVQCAIEELKILNDYAPTDPWIHQKLATSYRELNKVEEEIHEYEILLKINPHDPLTLTRLGKLYFSQGKNAQGLRLYETLLTLDKKMAQELISYYNSSMLI